MTCSDVMLPPLLGADPTALLCTARARIADVVTAPYDAETRIGEIALREHQREAVAALHQILERSGGAVLADAAGLGKTYVALAVARRYARVLVAAPAALRDRWHLALRRAEARASIVSLEWLSRHGEQAGAGEHDLVIVDEAHHLRTPATRRYAAVAELTRHGHVLLLSATPVQNRREDLLALLALFLGEHAFGLSDEDAAAYVVRRTEAVVQDSLPALEGPRWIVLEICDDDCLEALLALPPPLPAADEGDAGVLLLYTLARQWASSRAALTAALRRRLARGVALEAALGAGQLPTRRDLAAWAYAEDAVQLAFAELLTETSVGAHRSADLLATVRAHGQAVRALLSLLGRTPDPDQARANALRELRARSGGARIIAFAQFTETVRALARLLSRDPGVAALTAGGARVAGGRISRGAVLAQFGAEGRDVARAERIDLLLATDVLSEGLDLQQASMVVHLDLPWNPARLEQRVGRIRRLGSPHQRVSVHALAPPAAPERLLRLEQRLREKVGVAMRLVGAGDAVLPDLESLPGRSAVEQASALTVTLSGWSMHNAVRGGAPASEHHDRSHPAVIAAVRSTQEGWLARVDDNGAVLVADLGGGPSTDADLLTRAVAFANGDAAVVDPSFAENALAALQRWWWHRRGERAIPLDAGRNLRRQLAARIAACIDRARRSRRAAMAALGTRAREVLSIRLGAGTERRLARLLASAADDESWLRSLAEVADGERSARRAAPAMEECGDESIPLRALILLQPLASPAVDVPLAASPDQDGPPDEGESATARR